MFLRFSQIFSGVVAALNFCNGVTHLFAGNYSVAAINIVCMIVLVYLVVLQQCNIATMRPESRAHARLQLDACWKAGVCPDCAKASLLWILGGIALCKDVQCRSRFYRDPKTGTWSRI